MKRSATLRFIVRRKIMAASLALFVAPVALSAEETPYWEHCEAAVDAQEQAQGIPDSLLLSIARAESGRFREGVSTPTPWPWTVMAERRGRYLPTKAAAIREVEQLQRRGVRNIDVGCMQINLHHHGRAFASLEEAFDPNRNAAYAGTFLNQLHRELGSWTRAVGYYHSRTSGLYQRYRKKVLGFWEDQMEADAPRTAALPSPEPEPEIEKDEAAVPAATLTPPRRISVEEALARQARRAAVIRASADVRRGLAERAIARQRAAHEETVRRQRALLESYRDQMRAATAAIRENGEARSQ